MGPELTKLGLKLMKLGCSTKYVHAQINKIGAKMDLERAKMEHASTQLDKVGGSGGPGKG